MTGPAIAGAEVAKKKTSGKDQPKQYGSLIRVSDEFAEAIRQASSFEGMSMREFADACLLQVVRKRYQDGVLREAKKFGGKGQP